MRYILATFALCAILFVATQPQPEICSRDYCAASTAALAAIAQQEQQQCAPYNCR